METEGVTRLHEVHRRWLHQGRVDDVLYVVTHDTLGLKKEKIEAQI